MSKPSRRPNREAIKELKRKKSANIRRCAHNNAQTA
jgi:hypothetical protein